MDLSAPKGRDLNLGFLRVWWTLSSDLTYLYLPDRPVGSPPGTLTMFASGRRNCDVWYADY